MPPRPHRREAEPPHAPPHPPPMTAPFALPVPRERPPRAPHRIEGFRPILCRDPGMYTSPAAPRENKAPPRPANHSARSAFARPGQSAASPHCSSCPDKPDAHPADPQHQRTSRDLPQNEGGNRRIRLAAPAGRSGVSKHVPANPQAPRGRHPPPGAVYPKLAQKLRKLYTDRLRQPPCLTTDPDQRLQQKSRVGHIRPPRAPHPAAIAGFSGPPASADCGNGPECVWLQAKTMRAAGSSNAAPQGRSRRSVASAVSSTHKSSATSKNTRTPPPLPHTPPAQRADSSTPSFPPPNASKRKAYPTREHSRPGVITSFANPARSKKPIPPTMPSTPHLSAPKWRRRLNAVKLLDGAAARTPSTDAMKRDISLPGFWLCG